MDTLHVDTDEGEKKRKKPVGQEWWTHEWKKELTGGTGMSTQGHGHVGGRVGMWTRMCCVWMQMSRREKKTYFVNADGGRVGLQMCCVWMQMSRKERKNLL